MKKKDDALESKTKTERYYLPSIGRSIEASDIDEAIKKGKE